MFKHAAVLFDTPATLHLLLSSHQHALYLVRYIYEKRAVAATCLPRSKRAVPRACRVFLALTPAQVPDAQAQGGSELASHISSTRSELASHIFRPRPPPLSPISQASGFPGPAPPGLAPPGLSSALLGSLRARARRRVLHEACPGASLFYCSCLCVCVCVCVFW
jgi:hypothetical protein